MDEDRVKRYLQIWWEGIKSLPQTTSIHGFRYIGDFKRHWIERLFWLIFVILSWYGSMLLIAAQYDAFQNKPISFVVETTYKDWNTQFPSIAVCENENSGRIENVSDILWGQGHEYEIEEILKEIAYFKGVTYYVSDFCGTDNALEECFESNLYYYANLVRSGCREILSNCSWNDETFDCCTHFVPMETEFGKCYVINSIQGSKRKAPNLEMISNRTTGPGMIKFDVSLPVKVFVLNEEEVPSLTSLGSDFISVTLEFNYRRQITIKNIENDVDARKIVPEKRKCRYINENILNVYPYYSYTACTVQCRKNAQMRLCNCTNFFMPNTSESEKCNITGILCLNEYVQQLSVLKARWSSRPGLHCDCLPSCTEAEISIVKDFNTVNSRNRSTVQVELSSLPTERYRRNVVRGVLDLVVSTGGTGGLFLGASILSFVELIYILLLRPFCDIYSQRNEDQWHRKYGNRLIEDNKFKLNSNFALNNMKKQLK
ncbi:sodium channel protein Nach-like [Melitaea cinxia]|uniref:sodium channel protein Nach-like n=1 Tax=Melitaea cinxia TaxID=113334 RepID=UPI001E26F85B|nr:sodium channel protein Nach-like [Melitaea cinxia]